MRFVVLSISLLSFLYGGAKVEGWIYDQEDRTPIPYASLGIKNTNFGTVCDGRGYFVIIDVPAGKYDIEASCVGYQSEVKKEILVRSGHPVELHFYLKASPIPVKPIVSVAKQPKLTKEMVGTTVIVRPEDIGLTPRSFSLEKIMIQPAVSYTGTTYHVRGGRANEVLYLVDGVPVIDPQNGDLGLTFHQGMMEEAIFFPGTFGVEYGRALSGVVNIISPPVSGINLKSKLMSEKPLTDFGFFNLQPTLIISPLLLTGDLTTTDDWDPRLFVKPHKQRQDYCIYAKSKIPLKKELKLDVSGARSRTQFDRYHPDWRFRLDHYRSDLKIANLITSDVTFLPKTNALLSATFSYFETTKEHGVRDPGLILPYEDINFREYDSYERPERGINNPTGWDDFYVSAGDYQEYLRSKSGQWFSRISAKIQLNPHHQIYIGANGYFFDIDKLHVIYPYHVGAIVDDYHYRPKEYGIFLQDGIEYHDLFLKVGTRFDRYDNDLGLSTNSISPRIGFSFMIKENLLMRVNIGRYVQPPFFDQVYALQGYEDRTLPDDSPTLIGNPDLKPEMTTATEIGFQGRLTEGVDATTTFFYKDVGDLIGTRLVYASPVNYSTYMNVDYANVKGVELVLSLYKSFMEGHISYTLSYARGTSSYATEGYNEYIAENPESVPHYPKSDYPLDFDQRHRIFFRTTFYLPQDFELFTYLYLGSGYPYTPPGGKGDPATMNVEQGPFRKDLGISINRQFRLSKLKLNISFEILNALDFRDIRYVYPATGLPNDNGIRVERSDFAGGWTLYSRYYHPGQDLDHDGFVTGEESYLSYLRANFQSMDWPNNYGPSRRYRLGLSFEF